MRADTHPPRRTGSPALPWAWAAPCLALGAVLGCAPAQTETAPFSEDDVRQDIRVLERTPFLVTYPCVELCHSVRDPDPGRRELTSFHSLRAIRHGNTDHWCSFCHSLKDVDLLKLLDGSHVTFDQTYRLCGQCHGDKLRDWEEGIHGLTTGHWNGDALRRSCPVCHDPHSPTRPSFEALPRPRRPEEREGGHAGESAHQEGSHD